MTFIETVCNMGEASRKSSNSEARYVGPSSSTAENSNVVMFGKTKWPKGGCPPRQDKVKTFRLTLLLKRGIEGAVMALSSRSMVRERRRGSGLELISKNRWTPSQTVGPKQMFLICCA